MGKIFKGYLAFTSVKYRIWGLIFFPALFLAVSVFTGNIALTGGFIIMFEVISDYWLFSGICEKNSNYTEYCKTSVRGIKIIKKGLEGDLLRRFLYLMILAAAVCFRSKKAWVFVQVLLIYMLSTAALNVTRLWSGVWIQLIMSSFVFLAYTLFQMILFVPPVSVMTLFFAAGSVFASVATVWHALIRMKGSYYEEGSNKGF